MASVAMCAIASRYFCSIIVDERRESVGFERSFFVGRSAWRQTPKRAHSSWRPTHAGVCVCVTSWRRFSGLRATGWRDALATPPPPSRLPLSRYATRTRSSPPRDRGCSLQSAILNFRHAPSTRGGGPATRPTHTTLLTLSPASSFDDNSADSPRNRPPAATTR